MRELRTGHTPFVEVRPDHGHRHDPGFPRAGGHLEGVAPQVLRGQILHALSLQFWHIPTELAPPVHRGLVDEGQRKQVLSKHLGISIYQGLGVVDMRYFDQIH